MTPLLKFCLKTEDISWFCYVNYRRLETNQTKKLLSLFFHKLGEVRKPSKTVSFPRNFDFNTTFIPWQKRKLLRASLTRINVLTLLANICSMTMLDARID